MFEQVKMILPMGILYLTRQFDEKDENIVFGFRLYFTIVTILIAGLYSHINNNCIKASDDEEVLMLSEKDLQPANPIADAMGADNNLDAEKKPWTVSDYDTKICNEKIKQMAIQTLIICAIHYKWEYIVPLILSPTMALINLIDDKLVAIYMLGKDPKKDPSLKRPFAAPKGAFDDLMKAYKETTTGDEAEPVASPADPPAAVKGKKQK